MPSHIGLPRTLVADVLTSIRIYDTIVPASPSIGRLAAAGLRMTITRGDSRDSVYHVSPKNLGGKAWLASTEYSSAIRTWANTGFEPLSPCVAFGWLGTQRKAIARSDVDDCDAMTLLGAVDFDMDRVERFASGFAGAIETAKRHTAEPGTRMQSAALAALLNYDVQQYVRPIQEGWSRNGRGAANLGPRAISPEDWVATLIADNTSLCGFAYQGAARYTENKVGGFVALLLSNTHDLMYDLATSNLMSSVMYAAAAGVTQDNIPCIFVTSLMDGLARRICTGAGCIENSLFGDNATFAAGVWADFSERYRTWERFVKYSRQIARSTSTEARNIAEKAAEQLVMADCDFVDVANAWRQATMEPSSCHLIPRLTIAYVPGAAPEIAEDVQPDLCMTCMLSFKEALDGFASDEIRGVEGLSASIAGCQGVARAAAIRRATLFAASDICCDLCACRIGCWADMISHRVLSALISTEPTSSAAEWLLQCYTVWTVMSFPVSVATILSGFDLCCEMNQDEGAMGNRDVLDC
ncbi:hypothetical protein B0H17DRAFT_951103 [Mycena rosella]|uniref:Uncharacterized protein n=1 Tax=Mycena rosella TaxID=1033263 RepID=A0AAD7G4C3_MYCRO|nr:hypothetical protein B0H17DRAFT_951103 [Mycena rosella]